MAPPAVAKERSVAKERPPAVTKVWAGEGGDAPQQLKQDIVSREVS